MIIRHRPPRHGSTRAGGCLPIQVFTMRQVRPCSLLDIGNITYLRYIPFRSRVTFYITTTFVRPTGDRVHNVPH